MVRYRLGNRVSSDSHFFNEVGATPSETSQIQEAVALKVLAHMNGLLSTGNVFAASGTREEGGISEGDCCL